MKIAKQHLRRIIKEELQNTFLKEGFFEIRPEEDAERLYELLDGITSSEEDKIIRSIIFKEHYSKPQNMVVLYDAFSDELKKKDPPETGDLIDWLAQDWLSDESIYVSSQLRHNKYGPRKGQN